MTVIQCSLPTLGPGALKIRDVTPSATKKVCTVLYIIHTCIMRFSRLSTKDY